MGSTGSSSMKQAAIWLAVVILFSCRPLVTTFSNSETAMYYTASTLDTEEFYDVLKVMTWNIRFGAARIPWFGDSCGERVLMTDIEIITNTDSIVSFINTELPDILLIQEIDVSSKRSAYINQIQYILDRTHFNYGAYASMWDAEIIPSDGLGKVDVGNAILSRWEITDAERIQLSLRTDQGALTQYFYLRRNILKVKIAIPSFNENFYAVNIHATAFATDDTKQKHIAKYKEVLDELDSQGAVFITGGDLNSIPPNADSKDFCMEDSCSGETFHMDSDGGPHREGSYFENFVGEPDLIQQFYDDYKPAISLNHANDLIHCTHSPWNTDYASPEYWDRKLDYLFTNYQVWSPTGETHNDIDKFSDHSPVTATLDFSK